MASITTGKTAKASGFNLDSLMLPSLLSYKFELGDETTLRLYDDAKNYIELQGTGFVFTRDDSGKIIGATAGTITGIAHAQAGSVLFSMSGTDVEAASFFAATDMRQLWTLFTASDETYIINRAADRISEAADGGTDTVKASVSYKLDDHIERLELAGTANINATGNSLKNILTGNDGNNILDGGAGADTMKGGKGDDTYIIDNNFDLVSELLNGGTDTVISTAEDYRFGANVENITIAGTGNFNAQGNASANVMKGNGGDNILLGLAGDDQLSGGGGNDQLYGGSGNDAIVGGAGADWMEGGDGSDIYDGSAASNDSLDHDTASFLAETGNGVMINGTKDDIAWEGGVVLAAGKAVDAKGDVDTIIDIEEFRGSSQDDVIFTGSKIGENRWVAGHAGNDILAGGDGIDTVRYDLDAVNSQAEWGIQADLNEHEVIDSFGNSDEVSGIENLRGTSISDLVFGDAQNNVLEGLGGSDSIQALDGDDVLVGDAGGDSLDGGNGFDTLDYSKETGKGGIFVRNGSATDSHGDTDAIIAFESIIGTHANDVIYAEQLEENGVFWLSGLGGDDVLVGSTAKDRLNYSADATAGGRLGIVANLAEGTVQDGFGDTDEVSAIEEIYSTRFADSIQGGALNETFVTLAGNDIVNGGTGMDTVSYAMDRENGGANGVIVNLGSSSLKVGKISVAAGTARDGFGNTDRLSGIESVIGTRGGDTIVASAASSTLYGMDGNDALLGGNGNDRLDGGTGADSMAGGRGNDTYVVDHAKDKITENAGSGRDVLLASVSFSLAKLAHVEDLTLTGSANIHATGNKSANTLTGNAANNALTGGAGRDTFVFLAAEMGQDIITDFKAGVAGDILHISQAVTGAHNVQEVIDAFVVSGNDLVLTLPGDGGSITLKGAAGATLTQDNILFVITPIEGGEGNDTVNGTANKDILNGKAGDDSLFGFAERDLLNGNDGDDILEGGAGADALDGGAGSDTASYSTSGAGVQVSLASGSAAGGDAEGDTLASIENLTGSAFDDELEGNDAANRLEGGGGTDMLFGLGGDDALSGGDGDDYLLGGDGNDRLSGGAGHDYLYGEDGDDVLMAGLGDSNLQGGDGADIFTFDAASGTHAIEDWKLGADKIDLSGLDVALEDLTIALTSDGYTVTFGGLSIVLWGVMDAAPEGSDFIFA